MIVSGQGASPAASAPAAASAASAVDAVAAAAADALGRGLSPAPTTAVPGRGTPSGGVPGDPASAPRRTTATPPAIWSGRRRRGRGDTASPPPPFSSRGYCFRFRRRPAHRLDRMSFPRNDVLSRPPMPTILVDPPTTTRPTTRTASSRSCAPPWPRPSTQPSSRQIECRGSARVSTIADAVATMTRRRRIP